MKIGEVAKRTGVAASAIRYYESQGLIGVPMRDDSGYRRYSESAVKKLQLIKNAQKLGFSLGKIQSMLLSDGRCSRPLTLGQINIRLEELDRLEADLRRQRQGLLSLKHEIESDIPQSSTCLP